MKSYDTMNDCATAIINPKLCSRLTIQVEIAQQANCVGIPHVRVYHDKSRNPEKCSYVCLHKAEYCDLYKNAPLLSAKLKDEFIALMTAVYVRPMTGERMTGYEMSVSVWAETYEWDCRKFTFNDTNELIMPDYTKLKTI